MDSKDTDILRENHIRLIKTLEAPILLNHLYQEGALSEDDKEGIRAKKTSIRQNEKLLNKLSKRKDGLKMLIKALLVSEVQGFLGNELLEKVAWSEQEMKQFRLELKGKVGHQQMMEADMAALKQDFRQLEVMCDEIRNNIKDLTYDSQMLKASNAVLKANNAVLKANVLDLKRENNQLKVKIDQSQNTLKEVTDKLQMLETNMAVLKGENSQLKGGNANQNTKKDDFAHKLKEKDKRINRLTQELRELRERDEKAAVKQEALQLQSYTGITETLDKLGEKVQENNEILKSLKEDQAQKKKEGLKQESHQLESAVTDVIMESQEILEEQGKERRRDKPSRLREMADKSGHMRMEVRRLGFLA